MRYVAVHEPELKHPESSKKSPVTFVAEIASNHSASLERLTNFVAKADEAGFEALKIQLFKVTSLFDQSILDARPELLQRSLWELPGHLVPRIANSARQVGLKLGCTPFYLRAVDELKPYVDFLKIASYELLWEELLVACGKTGLPVVLSTGMATIQEVDRAVKVLLRSGCQDLTLLHCVSAYPAPIDDANLAAIQTLREHTGLPVGWSDHSNDPSVIYRAVHHWGASFVEMHFDLDGEGAEFAPGHCWLPETAAEVIRNVKNGFAADGHGRKEPAPSELADRAWRADPSDGLRPTLAERARWINGAPEPR